MYNPSSAFGTSNSEIDKYLYVQIKLLNLVEVAYIENRIDETTYKSKLSQLMTKINSLKAQLPHFNPDAFFQTYALNNQNFAFTKIKSASSNTVENKFQTLMKLYDKCKNFLAVLEVKALSEPAVKHFSTDLSEILLLIQKAKSEGVLQDNFCGQFVVQLRNLSESISQRNLNDLLSKDECIDLAYAFEDILLNLKRIMKIE